MFIGDDSSSSIDHGELGSHGAIEVGSLVGSHGAREVGISAMGAIEAGSHGAKIGEFGSAFRNLANRRLLPIETC